MRPTTDLEWPGHLAIDGRLAGTLYAGVAGETAGASASNPTHQAQIALIGRWRRLDGASALFEGDEQLEWGLASTIASPWLSFELEVLRSEALGSEASRGRWSSELSIGWHLSQSVEAVGRLFSGPPQTLETIWERGAGRGIGAQLRWSAPAAALGESTLAMEYRALEVLWPGSPFDETVMQHFGLTWTLRSGR